jgi:hypothetical protein
MTASSSDQQARDTEKDDREHDAGECQRYAR